VPRIVPTHRPGTEWPATEPHERKESVGNSEAPAEEQGDLVHEGAPFTRFLSEHLE
jgi:hypothetical protein